MGAAVLYAFANARGKEVLCFAHVTNQMALTDGDFEKGEANGARDALRLIDALVDLHRPAITAPQLRPVDEDVDRAGRAEAAPLERLT